MHNAPRAQIRNLTTHCAQAPSTVSGSLVAHQHTSPVVFFSAVNEETLCIIVPAPNCPRLNSCHAQTVFTTRLALFTIVTKQVDHYVHMY